MHTKVKEETNYVYNTYGRVTKTTYANGNPVMNVDPNRKCSKAFQAVFSAVGIMMMIGSGAKQQAIIIKN